ncbi:MAG: hypothetical protein VX278_12860 [Myxococcota bacterium]|nr:hypothetical protein [Myxococcota bacterium]
MKFELYFTRLKPMGVSDFETWKTQNQEAYDLLLALNARARAHCETQSPEDGRISREQGETARQILADLSTIGTARTNFYNNIDYACDVEGLSDTDAFYQRYPGLEGKDYYATSAEIISAQFDDRFDPSQPDHKIFPAIHMASSTIEIPIRQPADFQQPEGLTPFCGIFQDAAFILAGCWYEAIFPGYHGWNKLDD